MKLPWFIPYPTPRWTFVAFSLALCWVFATAGDALQHLPGRLHPLWWMIGGVLVWLAAAGRSIIPSINFGTDSGSPKPSDAAASSPSPKETPIMANKPVDAVASLLKGALDANKPEALALIQAAEGSVQAFVVNLLRSAKFSGVEQMLYKLVEPKLEANVAAFIAKEGPEVVFDLIDGFLARESVA